MLRQPTSILRLLVVWYPCIVNVMEILLQVTLGRKAKALIENARRSIAKELSVKAKEIVFTASGTEANNWVIKHVVAHLGVRRVITSRIEHKCVARAIEYVQDQGAEVVYIANDASGIISCDALEEALAKSDHPTLVAIMHANNELGTLQPVQQIGELCQKYKALFFSDTVQTIGHYQFCPRDYHMDFCSASAHKFHGPKRVGFVYINENHRLQPWILGEGKSMITVRALKMFMELMPWR